MTPKNKLAKRSKRPVKNATKKARQSKIKAETGEAARIHQNIYAPNEHGAEVGTPR